ncbi:UDP-N-acetylglucosamine 2-epimerase (non-hydrolyzing) [Brevibacterium sp. ZH18]|uniref:non-hydrolyzing UDP-N-acetylglucosamine 2-epimerase n=1 Tax=Brevibacterium sp. ZH18 TaxID=2927784 RepID=UPI001F624F01|nr:UDP-N-acetylglucosamine 2-epimerase (non-hydrolyzing) [Brevibacterium sp. ZH18]MCI4012586.1 UDP-N-acetylglucosamine 2-epimerase (non-hydrolyzing) [Brevibacterium sp. ZH18]
MRVVSIVGARPQFVKLAPMAKAFSKAHIDHKIVHTGQHYDVNMSDAFFQDLGIPDPDIHLGVGSGSHGVQTGNMLAQMDQVLMDLQPDWVLVYGDTNSTVAGALSAVKLQFPLAHLEAGLRSNNRAMPEEHNRVLTDHAADICLAPSSAAMECLAKEGLSKRAELVGDVMVDVCYLTRDAALNSELPVPGVERGERFLLSTIHRAENTDDPDHLARLIETLSQLPLPVVLPAHPRLVAKTSEFGIRLGGGSLRVVDPLSYPEMVKAIIDSDGVVTDSGGVQKEAFLLDTPCTTLRTETEWVETLQDGWNVLDPDLSQVREIAVRPKPHNGRGVPYGDGDAARAAVEAILKHQ